MHSGHQNQENKSRDSFMYKLVTEQQTNARHGEYGEDFVLRRNLSSRSQGWRQLAVWSSNGWAAGGSRWCAKREGRVMNSPQSGSRREGAMFKQGLEVANDFAKGRQWIDGMYNSEEEQTVCTDLPGGLRGSPELKQCRTKRWEGKAGCGHIRKVTGQPNFSFRANKGTVRHFFWTAPRHSFSINWFVLVHVSLWNTKTFQEMGGCTGTGQGYIRALLFTVKLELLRREAMDLIPVR